MNCEKIERLTELFREYVNAGADNNYALAEQIDAEIESILDGDDGSRCCDETN